MSKKTKPDSSAISQGNEHSKAKKKADWDMQTVFLLFDRDQFALFEKWIQLGLIYLDPNDENKEGKLKGKPEAFGALPWSIREVSFDVLVQVELTREEFDGAICCSGNEEFGWIYPGILPVSRIQQVLFQTQDLLEEMVRLLGSGANVPEVLKSYQKEWHVGQETDFSEEDVCNIFGLEEKELDPIKTLELLHTWDASYGQLSFLRSVALAFPDIYQATILGYVKVRLKGVWKDFELFFDNMSKPWSLKTIFELFQISEIVKEYAWGNSGPEPFHMLMNKEDAFSKTLGQLTTESDCWWGSRLAADQPLRTNFEHIRQMREQLSPLFMTEVLGVFSCNARRLNITKRGDLGQSSSRSRNFEFEGKRVTMTCSKEDSMNSLIAESCFNAIQERPFHSDFWSDKLRVDSKEVLGSDENCFKIFGIEIQKIDEGFSNALEELACLAEVHANESKNHIEKIKKLEQKLSESEKRAEKSESKLRRYEELITAVKKQLTQFVP